MKRRAYELPNALSNGTSPTQLSPYGLQFPKIGGSQPRTKTAIARSIISGTGRPLKLRISNLADTFKESIRTKAHEKFGRKESVGVSRDSANFLSTPYYPSLPGTGKATNFRILYAHSQDRSKQKHIKISGKVAVGPYSGTVKNFQGTHK